MKERGSFFLLKSTEKILLERQDEELVKLIQEGNKEALEVLYIRYKGLIYESSYCYMIENHVAQMYLDDLVDVAVDALFIAVKDFVVGENKSFLNYWWLIANRRQTTFLQKTIDAKVLYYDPHIIENASVASLSDSQTETNNDMNTAFIKIISNNASAFSQNERCFLEYYILGYKPLEIAEFFSWNKSKLYRIKKKAMDKLNKIIKSN